MSLPDVLSREHVYEKADKHIRQTSAMMKSQKEAPMHSAEYKYEKRRAALFIALAVVVAIALQILIR